MHILIPARTDSKRLPRKLYLPIQGVSLIERTWRSAQNCAPESVTIACKDAEIADFCRRFGATTWMTDGTERNGTEAVAQIVSSMALHPKTIIVLLQGDEPGLNPITIARVPPLVEPGEIATLCYRSYCDEPVPDDVVCVVPGKRDDIATFVRGEPPTPWVLSHIGIYGFTVGDLAEYLTWPPAEQEIALSLEQMRWIANGTIVRGAVMRKPRPPAINTSEDAKMAEKYYEKLMK